MTDAPDHKPHEPVYIMRGEPVPASQMQKWHNDRGLPWGVPFEGPDPFTVSRMVWPDNLRVHLANEHHVDPDLHAGTEQHAHMLAHTIGQFRSGQEHYHNAPGEPWPG